MLCANKYSIRVSPCMVTWRHTSFTSAREYPESNSLLLPAPVSQEIVLARARVFSTPTLLIPESVMRTVTSDRKQGDTGQY